MSEYLASHSAYDQGIIEGLKKARKILKGVAKNYDKAWPLYELDKSLKSLIKELEDEA